MTYPTQDTAHAAEALALLTDHYKGKTNIQGLLNSFNASVQELENMFWDIINKFLMSNIPTGDQLNQIGKIVGASRRQLSDADYYQEVLLQIRANRSQGLTEDVIQVATLALRGVSKPDYLDMPPAQFIIEAWNLVAPLVVVPLLTRSRSVGTRGILHYTTWADGSDFEFTSRYDSSAGELGWGSRYDSTVGGLLVAGAQL